jgi:hypothetical protein
MQMLFLLMRKKGALLALVLLTGCSVLIGNVKPAYLPGDNYTVRNMVQISASWVAVPAEKNEGDEKKMPDLFFHSKKTKASVSLSSACKSHGRFSSDLEGLTKELFSLFGESHFLESKKITFSGLDALETHQSVLLSGEKKRVVVIVGVLGSCVYDFVLVSNPDNFTSDYADFDIFLHSFQVKP